MNPIYKIQIDGVAYDRDMIETVQERLEWHSDLDQHVTDYLISSLQDTNYHPVQVLTCEYIMKIHDFRDEARASLISTLKDQPKTVSPVLSRIKQQEQVIISNGPLLHEPFLLGDRVKVTELDVIGEITGISSHYLVAMYIVTVSEEDAIMREGYSNKATTFCCCHSMLTLQDQPF